MKASNKTIFNDEVELKLLSELEELKQENEFLLNKIDELQERIFTYEFVSGGYC